MPWPRNSLRAFLQHAKGSLAQALNGSGKVNIVIGNESAGKSHFLNPFDKASAH